MSVVNQRLEQVVLGDLQRFGSLSLVPLFAEASSKLEYSLLDEALADGTAVIEEVSESGSVPEIAVPKHGERSQFSSWTVKSCLAQSRIGSSTFQSWCRRRQT